MTAPAVVSWAAHLGRMGLQGTSLAFMGSTAAVAVFTVGAIVELVADQLPKAPSRTKPVPLTARIVMGGLSGACVCAAASESLALGALFGAAGGVAGAFGGWFVRTRLVRALGVKDVYVAVPEDVVAIALAYLFTFVR